MTHDPTNPHDEMRDAQLDAILAAADPARRAIKIDKLNDQWAALAMAMANRRRRRFLTAGSLAMAACLLLALGFLNPGRNDDAVTIRPIPTSDDRPAAEVNIFADGLPNLAKSADHGTLATPDIVDRDPETKSGVAKSPLPLIDQFAAAVVELQPNDPRARYRLVMQLRRMPPASQRELIAKVPALKDAPIRRQAMTLIFDAAGVDAAEVQAAWLAFDSTRDDAWLALIHQSNASQWASLAKLASSEVQRESLCQRLVADWNSGGLDALIELAAQPDWRLAVGISASGLDQRACIALMNRIDDRQGRHRVGAGFVLAAIDRAEVDQMLMQMIVQGSRRLAAYQALIARDTPAARQFLAMSAGRYDLSPALVAARQRWLSWGPQAFQWVSETRSRNDVQNSILFDGPFHCLRVAAASFDRMGTGCG